MVYFIGLLSYALKYSLIATGDILSSYFYFLKFAKRLGRSVHADMWALSVMVGLGRHVGVICRVVNIILFSAIIDLSGSITLLL